MTGEPSARNAEAGEPAEGFGERFAVEGGHIAVEPSLGALVNPPAGMFDALFERRAVALAVVAPVMFGDELRLGTFGQRLCRSPRGEL